MASSGQSFADGIKSEVALSLFTALARCEGPSLSDVPMVPARWSHWAHLLTSRPEMAHMGSCPALVGPLTDYFLGLHLLVNKCDQGISLVVRWLGIHASIAGEWLKWCGQKINKLNK